MLGEVEWVVEGSDAVSTWVFVLLQVGPKDGIVHHVQEGGNGMPAFVVEPHLQKTTDQNQKNTRYLSP